MQTTYYCPAPADSIIFTSTHKEDQQDRIPTSSSMQLTSQEDHIHCKRKKKISIFQTKKSISLMVPQQCSGRLGVQRGEGESVSKKQNQRLIQKQEGEYETSAGQRRGRGTAARRNRIFSNGMGVKKSKIYDQTKENYEDADSTKRGCQRRISEAKSIHRLPFTLFRNDSYSRLPSPPKEYQKSTFLVGSCTELVASEIQQVFTNQTQRPQQTQEEVIHFNPVSKKLKQINLTKRKTSEKIAQSRPSFDKIYKTNPISKPPLRMRFDQVYYSNSVGSRLSQNNTSLRQNIIGHSLAACNIKLADSFSSDECENGNERYFDHEEERKPFPLTQKISYRNIDIQQGMEGIDDAPQIRHHNLFSDFECSRKKEGLKSISNSPKREERKIAKELFKFSEKETTIGRGRWHVGLVMLAVMMLLIQILG